MDTDDSGWKMVHADVFRPPEHGLMLLSAIVGTGVQVGLMLVASVVLALCGYISPESRGTIINLLLVLYVVFSFANGYVATHLYLSWGGKHTKQTILLTGTLLPCVVFGIYSVQNAVSAYYHSTTAVSFFSILKLVGIWLGLSLPLVFIGAYRGIKKAPYEPPSPPAPFRARSRRSRGTCEDCRSFWWVDWCRSAWCSWSCTSSCRRCGWATGTTSSGSCSS